MQKWHEFYLFPCFLPVNRVKIANLRSSRAKFPNYSTFYLQPEQNFLHFTHKHVYLAFLGSLTALLGPFVHVNIIFASSSLLIEICNSFTLHFRFQFSMLIRYVEWYDTALIHH